MSYELSDEQVGIMFDASESRRNHWASQYICVNVDEAVSNRFNIERSTQHPVAREKVLALQQAIHAALGGRGSMLTYLIKEVPGYAELDIRTMLIYANLARNAWLQRMIETRRIA